MTTTPTPTDFAAILSAAVALYVGEAANRRDWYRPHAEAQLAAKVPELCPDCKGRGFTVAGPMLRGGPICTHPNAPTIGRMLAEWGPLVALAGGYAHHWLICPLSKPYFMPAPACTCGLDAARAALEAVRRG